MLRTFSPKNAFFLSSTSGPSVTPPDNPITSGLVVAGEFWQGNDSYIEDDGTYTNYTNHINGNTRILGLGKPVISLGRIPLSNGQGLFYNTSDSSLYPWNSSTGAGVDRTYLIWTYISTIRTGAPIISLTPDNNVFGDTRAIHVGVSAFNWSITAKDGSGTTATYTAGTPGLQFTKTLITVRANWDGSLSLTKNKNTSTEFSLSLTSLADMQSTGGYRIGFGGPTTGGGWGHNMTVGAVYAYNGNLSNSAVASIYDNTVNSWSS